MQYNHQPIMKVIGVASTADNYSLLLLSDDLFLFRGDRWIHHSTSGLTAESRLSANCICISDTRQSINPFNRK